MVYAKNDIGVIKTETHCNLCHLKEQEPIQGVSEKQMTNFIKTEVKIKVIDLNWEF